MRTLEEIQSEINKLHREYIYTSNECNRGFVESTLKDTVFTVDTTIDGGIFRLKAENDNTSPSIEDFDLEDGFYFSSSFHTFEIIAGKDSSLTNWIKFIKKNKIKLDLRNLSSTVKKQEKALQETKKIFMELDWIRHE